MFLPTLPWGTSSYAQIRGALRSERPAVLYRLDILCSTRHVSDFNRKIAVFFKERLQFSSTKAYLLGRDCSPSEVPILWKFS